MKRNVYAFLLSFLVLMMSGACSELLPATAGPTETPAPTATQPLLVEATPTQTTTARLPGPACFPSVVRQSLEPVAYSAYPEAILAYLNDAGSPVALSDELNILGVAAQPISVAVADFTGDGLDDVAAAIIDPLNVENGAHFIVFVCRQARYEILLTLKADVGYFKGFNIWFWQDMDADGATDLLISQGLCGAHSCFEDVKVMSWNGSMLTNRFQGSTADLPYPDIRLNDKEGDGSYEIEITSEGFGSVGAGPQRSMTYIWRLGPEADSWQQTEMRPGPSAYRIHVLHDADDAVARADYAYAIQLYRRVISDPNLEDWLTDEGGEALSAYARFRIFVIHLVLEDRPAADEAFDELESAYPIGNRLHDYVEMGILFRNAFNGGGLGSACTGAAGFAESHAGVVLKPLGSEVYGYANRDYTGESMCPAPQLQD